MKQLKRGDLVRVSPHEQYPGGVRAIVSREPDDNGAALVVYLEGFLAGQEHYRITKYIFPIE